MKMRILVASILVACSATSVFAQTAASTVQRDVSEQTRIENGLKDGSLSVQEASRLEKEQSQIDRLQAKDLKDSKLSAKERARLRSAQNKASRDILAAESNGVKGKPESLSSERMQADVQRNVTQEKRIEQGIKSGTLTNREASTLERGQAKLAHAQAKAGQDSHIGKREQAAIRHKENRQSEEIVDKKHNAQEHKV
jgi:hypothetical protein